MSTRKIQQKTETYRAIDGAGKEHLIDVYTDMIESTSLDGTTERVAGLRSHKMATNGNHVNVDGDGTLEEVATGRKMRRV